MSLSRNGNHPWGSPAAARARSSVNLFDVIDEELAAKLQREEEEQFEFEIAGRFGDDRQVGWCFVEVPSAGCEYGVMSVVQQEIPINECPSTADDDPDYTFALELQAQEADEYDRLRRQEEASMERIRIIQQEHPKREEIRQTLLQKFRFSSSSRSSLTDVEADDDAIHNTHDAQHADSSGVQLAKSGSAASITTSAIAELDDTDRVDCVDGGVTTSDASDTSDDVDDARATPSSARLFPHVGKPTVAAGSVEHVHLRDLDIHRGLYMDGDDRARLPRKTKLHSLSQALKHADRKQQRAYHHSYHRRPKTHGDQTTEAT